LIVIGLPSGAEGSGEIVVMTSGAGRMVRPKSLAAVWPAESVTWTVKMNWPAVIGIPLMKPVEEIDRPVGRRPPANDQV
jgi:hypothetical protein